MSVGISVIICCYNSESRLAPTLKHLAAQKNIDSSNCEVILVDNGSTDNTTLTARDIWNSCADLNLPLTIVEESTPGLSSARIKGIDTAKHDYVLFCDDDNWLDAEYLSIGLSLIRQSSDIGVLGGTGAPVFEEKEPPHFWKNQYHVLAVGEQSSMEGDITDTRGVVYGAGMILNKHAFIKLREDYNFKFQTSDRLHGSLASSGDHELCLALKQIGYRIHYSRKLKFKHYIPASRTTIDYYERLFYGFGTSYALLYFYGVDGEKINSIIFDYRYICLRSIKNILKTKVTLLLRGYYFTNDKYAFLDEVHTLFNNKGILKTFLKLKNSYRKTFSQLPIFNAKLYANRS